MKLFSHRKLHKDNRGVTLVEVIVSLLILALIVVPMLTVFNTSQKSASTGRKLSFAEMVGENCMEEVKALGVKTYKQKNGFQIGGTSKTLTDIAQGTDVFSAKVTILEDGVLNNVNYVDLTEFSSATTGLINPNVSDQIDYDDKAANRFLELNNDYFDDVWDKICEMIEDKNAEKILEDSNFIAMSTPARIPGLTYNQVTDEITQYISRDMSVNISLSGDPVDLGDGTTSQLYRVESGLTYTVDNNPQSGAAYTKIQQIKSTYLAAFRGSNAANWTSAEIARAEAIVSHLGLVCDTNDPNKDKRVTRTYSYYAHNMALANVKTLYMIYKPLFADTYGAEANTWKFKGTREQVSLKATGLNNDVKCYIIIQTADTTDFDKVGKLNVSIDNDISSPGKIKVASQAQLNMVNDGNEGDANNLYEVDQKKVVYKVKVEVFDSEGKLCTTVESTVVEE